MARLIHRARNDERIASLGRYAQNIAPQPEAHNSRCSWLT
jgi:hypothetical protein